MTKININLNGQDVTGVANKSKPSASLQSSLSSSSRTISIVSGVGTLFTPKPAGEQQNCGAGVASKNILTNSGKMSKS